MTVWFVTSSLSDTRGLPAASCSSMASAVRSLMRSGESEARSSRATARDALDTSDCGPDTESIVGSVLYESR